jgi:hypothetical protein
MWCSLKLRSGAATKTSLLLGASLSLLSACGSDSPTRDPNPGYQGGVDSGYYIPPAGDGDYTPPPVGDGDGDGYIPPDNEDDAGTGGDGDLSTPGGGGGLPGSGSGTPDAGGGLLGGGGGNLGGGGLFGDGGIFGNLGGGGGTAGGGGGTETDGGLPPECRNQICFDVFDCYILHPDKINCGFTWCNFGTCI